METLNEIFPVILYGLLIILVVVLIVLVIRLIKTLNKVDAVVDDVNGKVKKLDGVFNIVDTTADALSNFGDKFSYLISSAISALFTKKRKDSKNEEEDKDCE
jgi:uncharacterized protein YoxC